MSRDHKICKKCGILLDCPNVGIKVDSEEVCNDVSVTFEHIPSYEECNCLVGRYEKIE